MEQLGRVIGDNLRRLRAERGFSLDTLARESGVSKSRLGQIERGEANPSISTVWQIANAFRVEFSALVTAPDVDPVMVRRADIEPVTADDGRCRTYPLFAFDPVLGCEIYESELEPGGHLVADAHPAGTREVITVLSGSAEIRAGDEVHALGPGDAMRFLADQPHAYRNTGTDVAVLSMIVAYPRKD